MDYRDLLREAVGMKVAEAVETAYPSPAALLHATERELMALHGMGRARARWLVAAMGLGTLAVASERQRGDRIRSSRAVYVRMEPTLRHAKEERLRVLYIDTRHRIIGDLEIARGGMTACAVEPREILAAALRVGAVALILAHNHPSGDPTPSMEDIALTKRVAKAAAVMGLRLLDHVIVGDGNFRSLADSGLIPMGG